jgi:hypothetical protein
MDSAASDKVFKVFSSYSVTENIFALGYIFFISSNAFNKSFVNPERDEQKNVGLLKISAYSAGQSATSPALSA